MKRNAGAAALAYDFFDIKVTVALRIVERGDATLTLQRDVEISVGSDGYMPCRAEIVGYDKSAKARRKFQATIIGIASGLVSGVRAGLRKYRSRHKERRKTEGFH
jgi:hypothetical protein